MPRLKPSSRGVLLLYRQDRERVRTGQRAVWGVDYQALSGPVYPDVAAVGILPIRVGGDSQRGLFGAAAVVATGKSWTWELIKVLMLRVDLSQIVVLDAELGSVVTQTTSVVRSSIEIYGY